MAVFHLCLYHFVAMRTVNEEKQQKKVIKHSYIKQKHRSKVFIFLKNNAIIHFNFLVSL